MQEDEATEANCREMTIEEFSSQIRQDIETIKRSIVVLSNNSEFNYVDKQLSEVNIPRSRHANMKANITLAFRALEDARMRLGKVMQAYQGGVSIFDNAEKDRLGT